MWAPGPPEVAPSPSIGGASAMYATQVRPDSVHTSVLDGLVWIDPKLARFEMHPGLQEPGGSFPEPAFAPGAEHSSESHDGVGLQHSRAGASAFEDRHSGLRAER